MTEPMRQQVIDALVLLMQSISESRGDYTTPARVETELKVITEYNEFSVITVCEAPRSSLTLRDIETLFQHDFMVTIWGYVKKNQFSRSQLLQRLWADVIKKVVGNATLGGLVRDIVLGGPTETDAGTYGELGAFAQDFLVTFDEEIVGP